MGLKDVFAHGMLVMSYLGRAITNTILQSRLKDFKVRFCSITSIADILTCRGEAPNKVADSRNEGSMRRKVGITVRITNGIPKSE